MNGEGGKKWRDEKRGGGRRVKESEGKWEVNRRRERGRIG